MSESEIEKPEGFRERRLGKKAIPDDIEAKLTELQKLTIGRLSNFGWSIDFVRRPPFLAPTVVVRDPSGKDYAIVGEDGQLDRDTDLEIR